MIRSRYRPFLKELCVLGLLILFVLGGTARFSGAQDRTQHLYNTTMTNRWIRTGGPSGGLGYDVRIHPLDKNIMFVTDVPSGINKSIDGGATWYPSNDGVTVRVNELDEGAPIFSLTIDPNDPDIVWSGTQEAKGIFKSTDCGETWMQKDSGVEETSNISFRNFAIHPENSDIVFSGTEILTGILGVAFGKNKGKIYKTTDGGENWNRVWEGNSLVRFVLFDYLHPDTLYASTGIFDREAYNDVGLGILKSTNGGDDWFQINTGIDNLYLGFLDMHPRDPSILMAAAGTNVYRTGSGVYMTTNGGASWEKKLSSDHGMTVCVFSPSNTQVLYAGGEIAFYRSDDGGENWTEYMKEGGGYGPEGIRAGIPISAAVDPDDPMTVFVNNYNGGNFKSTDGGETWENSSKGYTGVPLNQVVINPGKPATVYTMGRGGPFRSYNGGEEWEGIMFYPANYPEWSTVVMHPTDPQTLLMTTEGDGQIYKTKDGGDSWRLAYEHPDGVYTHPDGFSKIAYSPTDPDIVYGGTCVDKVTLEGSNQGRPSLGMFKSTDGGENWQEINTGLPASLLSILSLAVHPRNDDIVYAGTWKDGIYKTTDGGQNWRAVNNGLGGTDVRSIAMDPLHPDTLFAGLSEGAGLYRSFNGGGSWEEVNTGIPLFCPHALLPAGRIRLGETDDPRLVVRRFGYSRVLWTSFRTVIFDPNDTRTLYAGDLHSGVYRSQDGGESWHAMNEGLSVRSVTSLAISGDSEILYAATSGGGVFRMVLQDNRVPQILSAFPSTEDTVFMAVRDSMLFRIQAFDLDGDTLRYEWFVNEQPIPTPGTSDYLFYAEIFGVGSHRLSAEISDRDSTITIEWNILISHSTVVQDESPHVETFTLHQNFPNPFNPETRITYFLTRHVPVRLTIYDLKGREVMVLVDEPQDGGSHWVIWEGNDRYDQPVPSGMYICQIKAGDFTANRKMMLLK